HGADELFGGYNRYKAMGKEEFLDRSKKDVECLPEGDVADARALVASTGHLLDTPYLDPAMIEHGLGLVYEERIEKKALRDVARELGLECADRKKKAAQFGSGASKLLRSLAKEKGLGEKELIRRYRVSP
ncbi:MAG: hypothetical protein KAT70_04540, partial [Thermoplasmata archaeon]|nr:hypothetical protein [Thermoplasmata archaeon]